MNKARTLLFALTGFGNNALNVLVSHELVELLGVVTKDSANKEFPYYPCRQLSDQASALGVPVYSGLRLKEQTAFSFIKDMRPDLIVVSTFDQLIPDVIIALPRLGIVNLHPSLLPRYRGATPTSWTLMNGETVTGVTAHFIENELIDQGRIICQKKMAIKPEDNDGILREKLAFLSESVLCEVLEKLILQEETSFQAQEESMATYYPKRNVTPLIIDLEEPFSVIKNRIRAVTPFPGALVVWNQRIYQTTEALLLRDNEPLKGSNEYLVIKTSLNTIAFKLAGGVDRKKELDQPPIEPDKILT